MEGSQSVRRLGKYELIARIGEGGMAEVHLSRARCPPIRATPSTGSRRWWRAAGLAGADVTVGQVTFEDTAALAGCSEPGAECFRLVADSLRLDQIVMGSVEPSTDGTSTVVVTLRLFRDGEITEKAYTLDATDVETIVQGLAREVPSLFVGVSTERPPDLDRDRDRDQPPPPPPPPPAPPPVDERGWSAGNVGAGAWLLTGGGVLLAGAGVVFLAMAQAKQDEVDSAPIDTPDDFDRLVALEDEGERLTLIGNGLMIGGGAALLVGGILVIVQGFPDEEEKPAVTIAPIPLRGGAGLTLEVTLP
jgi:hypothetical protein